MTLEQVEWVRAHSVPMRTIDPVDDDFADLDAFGAMVGDARVVSFGEQCHGDGATFHAKTRLISYLHQRLGFDVVVWESGLYDCRVAWQAFQRGEDPVTAAEQGIFPVWTRSVQVRPMWDYIARHASGPTPLELAGMDSQLTGRASKEQLVDDLRRRVGEEVADLFAGLLASTPLEPAAEQAALDVLAAAADAENADPFWAQCLRSLHSQLRARVLQRDGGVTAYSQERDLQMGANLVWLTNTAYAGRRLAVWVDTGHSTKTFESLGGPAAASAYAEYAPYVTSGNIARQALGEDLLTIGFTAAEGSAGHSDGPPATLGTIPLQDIVSPAPDSWEGLFLQAGLDNAIVDLRPRMPEDTWISEPRTASIINYKPAAAIWPNLIDAVVFTRRMYPSEVAAE